MVNLRAQDAALSELVKASAHREIARAYALRERTCGGDVRPDHRAVSGKVFRRAALPNPSEIMRFRA
ncbi:MAG: hypothetical protein U0325_02665 [Polyangiales bacterium]